MVHFTDGGGRSDEHLAPVIPLFGGQSPGPMVEPAPRDETPRRPVTFSDEYWADEESAPDQPVPDAIDAPDEPVDRDALREGSATSLVRSLARRGLSISEAKTRLRADGLTDDESATVIDDFIARGWLDDAVLAEQLVHSATTRKNMGSRAVRQLLMKRHIGREAIDEAMTELPDDDAERALEFARGKARALARLDDDTATRRLMGMLARRGFGGSVAGTAARTALADERRSAGGSGVRFR